MEVRSSKTLYLVIMSSDSLKVLNNSPWYEQGLRFKCTECGACCSGDPGYVWLSEEDIEALCTKLSLDRASFLKKYTRYVNGKYSLLEREKNYECIFLDEKNRCTVYSARPKQCKTFPWWPEQLKSETEWLEAKKRCEGIEHPDAPLIPLKQIQNELDS